MSNLRSCLPAQLSIARQAEPMAITSTTKCKGWRLEHNSSHDNAQRRQFTGTPRAKDPTFRRSQTACENAGNSSCSSPLQGCTCMCRYDGVWECGDHRRQDENGGQIPTGTTGLLGKLTGMSADTSTCGKRLTYYGRRLRTSTLSSGTTTHRGTGLWLLLR